MFRHLLFLVFGDVVYLPCKRIFHKANWRMGDPLYECDRPKKHKGRCWGNEIQTAEGE